MDQHHPAPATRPEPSATPQKPGKALLDALQLPQPSPTSLSEAEALRVMARHQRGGKQRITVLVETFCVGAWGKWSPIEEIDMVLNNDAIEALSDYPVWAVEAGLRRARRTRAFPPRLAEYLADVRAEYRPLVEAHIGAKRCVEQMEEIDRAKKRAPKSFSPAKLKVLKDLQNLASQIGRDGAAGGENGPP